MRIQWSPDRDCLIPYYAQTAAHIKYLIKNNLVGKDGRISERVLAEAFSVSRSTITRAFEILKDEGILLSENSRSTVISENARRLLLNDAGDWHNLAKRGRQPEYNDAIKSVLIRNTDNNTISVFKLNTEEFNPAQPFFEALKDDRIKSFAEYLPNQYIQGALPARKAAARYMEEYGIYSDPDNIITFNNWKEAFNCVANAILSPSARLLCMKSDMINNLTVTAMTGTAVEQLDYDSEGITPFALSKALDKPKRKYDILYLQPVNHIPTGITMSESRIRQLEEICRRRGILVIEADMTRDIAVNPPMPFKAVCKKEHAIYLGSLSLSCDTGLSSSWVVVPESIKYRICDVKAQLYTISSNMLDMLTYISIAGSYYQNHIKKIKAMLPRRVDKLNSILEKHLSETAKWHKERITQNLLIEFKHGIDLNKIYGNSHMHFFPGHIFPTLTKKHILINSNYLPLSKMEKMISSLKNLTAV